MSTTQRKQRNTIRQQRKPIHKNTRRGFRKSSNGVQIGIPKSDVETVIRMPAQPLFPVRTKRMMLPYYVGFQLTSGGTAAAGSYVFSLNGMYDPDVTGTGGQPMGFDQMMTFYEHYTVHRCEVVAVIRNQNTTLFADCSLAVRADSTQVTNVQTLMENGNAVASKLLPSPQFGSMRQLSLACDIDTFGGVDDLQDNEDYRGGAGSNPTEQTYLHVSLWNIESLTAVGAWVELRMKFHAVFTEPRVISISVQKKLKELVLANSQEGKV